jgi:hypothetical protein
MIPESDVNTVCAEFVETCSNDVASLAAVLAALPRHTASSERIARGAEFVRQLTTSNHRVIADFARSVAEG